MNGLAACILLLFPTLFPLCRPMGSLMMPSRGDGLSLHIVMAPEPFPQTVVTLEGLPAGSAGLGHRTRTERDTKGRGKRKSLFISAGASFQVLYLSKSTNSKTRALKMYYNKWFFFYLQRGCFLVVGVCLLGSRIIRKHSTKLGGGWWLGGRRTRYISKRADPELCLGRLLLSKPEPWKDFAWIIDYKHNCTNKITTKN